VDSTNVIVASGATLHPTRAAFGGSVAIYFPHFGVGGVEVVLLRLAKAFASKGHKVWLIVNNRSGRCDFDALAGVELVNLGVSASRYVIVPLRRFLRSRRPDIALSALSFNNINLFIASRLAGVPLRLVLTEHSPIDRRFSSFPKARDRRIGPWLVPWGYRKADAVVTVSRGVRDSLYWMGIPDHRLHTLPNPAIGVDFETAISQPVDHPWFHDPYEPIVIGVGRLNKDKDFRTLVRAFSRLRKDMHARLVIVGEGPEEAALKMLVDELKLNEDVWFTGYRANPCALIARSRVLALPSFYEGSPLVLVEALTCGCPIVATRTTGALDVLEAGRYGHIVPIGDAASMADAIGSALSRPFDPAPGRERAAMFSTERSADAYLGLFADLCRWQPRSGHRAYE